MKKCECFDFRNNMWIEQPELHSERSSCSVVVFENLDLFVFGGFPINNEIEFLDRSRGKCRW
jgi:hypothetical protein